MEDKTPEALDLLVISIFVNRSDEVDVLEVVVVAVVTGGTKSTSLTATSTKFCCESTVNSTKKFAFGPLVVAAVELSCVVARHTNVKF